MHTHPSSRRSFHVILSHSTVYRLLNWLKNSMNRVCSVPDDFNKRDQNTVTSFSRAFTHIDMRHCRYPLHHPSTWLSLHTWLGWGDPRIQGLYSLSRKTSYRKISWSLEVSRFGLRLYQLLWNLTGTSAATLPRCLSNFSVKRSL